MVQLSEFTGWQMSVRSSETWSFPAGASHTAAPAASLSPNGSADAPEQALKRVLWCCHQPLCTDNTLCGCDGWEPSPSPSICSVLSLAGWFLHVTPELSTCICVSVFVPVYICNCSCPWRSPLVSLSLTLSLSVSVSESYHTTYSPHLSPHLLCHQWVSKSETVTHTLVSPRLLFPTLSCTDMHSSSCHQLQHITDAMLLVNLSVFFVNTTVCECCKKLTLFIPKSFKSWWCNHGTSSGKKDSVSSRRSVIIFYHQIQQRGCKKSEKL